MDDLDLQKLPVSVLRYVDLVYGNEQEIDRLLSFKISTPCKDQIFNLLEPLIENAIKAGMVYQRHKDDTAIMDMQKQLNILIKRDGEFAKKRRDKLNGNTKRRSEH